MEYKFSDSKGNVYYGTFESREAAQHFAYVCGYCFLGKT